MLINVKKKLFLEKEYFLLAEIIFFQVITGKIKNCFEFWDLNCAIVFSNILAFRLNVLIDADELFNWPWLCLIKLKIIKI